jgi:hypothetical protein
VERALTRWTLAGAGVIAAVGCFLPGIDPSGSGSGGQGAGGTGGPCTVVDDCPVQTCFSVTCDQGLCKYDPTPGVLGPEQVEGDCKVVACNASGSMVESADETDLPSGSPGLCKAHACIDGEPTIVDSSCTGCCGTNNQLNCVAGVCTGCADASECGTDSFCGTFACGGGECSLTPLREGEPCGGATCSVGIIGPEEFQDVPLCTAGLCQIDSTSCGTYKCDGASGTCFTSCSSDPPCQPGSECDMGVGQCLDCVTCQELIGAGAVETCVLAKVLLTALIECFLVEDVACSNTCSGLTDAMLPELTQQ